MPYRSAAEHPGPPWHPTSLPADGGAAGRYQPSNTGKSMGKGGGNAPALAGGSGCTNLLLITINAALQLLVSLQWGPFLHPLSLPLF